MIQLKKEKIQIHILREILFKDLKFFISNIYYFEVIGSIKILTEISKFNLNKKR